MKRALAGLLILATAPVVCAQTRRMLFVSHSAGFRHDSIPMAREALQRIGARNGIDVAATEDLALLRREALGQFDAVFFFTSGELALDAGQKAALLDFVREGKGLAGAHSATDTLYSWPEYGELIGGYFDGHPWTHEARVEVEDAAHPVTRSLPAGFRLLEEFYQHRLFSRERVRVLMTLDTRSVDLRAAGVNRIDEDFALAWCRAYGSGRVFYTALGHFDETWRHPLVGTMLEGALRWITGLDAGDCAPRAEPSPRLEPVAAIAPGGVYELFGRNLTAGGTMTADAAMWSGRLAGMSVRVDGEIAPLLYASPEQINFQAPWRLRIGSDARVAVAAGNRELTSIAAPVRESLPRILAVTRSPGALTLWATGLGATIPGVPLGSPAVLSVVSRTAAEATVLVDSVAVPVLFSGAAPGWVGLYQVNVAAGELAEGMHDVELRMAGATGRFVFRVP
jgi:hypothetical protein